MILNWADWTICKRQHDLRVLLCGCGPGLGDSVYTCVNTCTQKPLTDADFIKCVKGCCAKHGIEEENWRTYSVCHYIYSP